MQIKNEMMHTRFDDVNIDVIFQLCAWHAMKIIQIRITRKEYSKEKKKKIHVVNWSWIKINKIDDLFAQRDVLLNELYEAERIYFIFYYQRQESTFVVCFIKEYSNFECIFTSTIENTHSETKQYVNRHTTINQSIVKLKENVNRQKFKYRRMFNKQQSNVSILMNIQSVTWKEIDFKITHEAIDMLIKKWVAMLQWLKKKNFEKKDENDEKICLLNCTLFKQFELFCKCFLYRCFEINMTISFSLIDFRWLFKNSDVVRRFNMIMNQNENNDENENDEISAKSSARFSFSFAIIIDANKYENSDRHLMKISILTSFEFHRNLFSHEIENYVRQKTKSKIAFREQWAVKKNVKDEIFHTFSNSIQKFEVKFKKKVSRKKRDFIEREMIEFKKRSDRQRQHVVVKKSKRTKLYEKIMQKEINQRALNKKKTMIIDVDEFNQIDFWFTDEKISKTSSVIFENENFMKYESYSEQSDNDSKNEKFKRNDFVFSLSEINFEIFVIVNFFFFDFFSSDSDSNFDEEISLLFSFSSSVIVASSRATISAILFVQQRLNQISHAFRRSIERVKVKFKHQLKLKSQKRANATKKKNQNSKRDDENQKEDQANDVTKEKCIAIEEEVSNAEFLAIKLTCNVM